MVAKDIDSYNYESHQGGADGRLAAAPIDFRITLSSRSVQSLEKVSNHLVAQIKKLHLKHSGPVRVRTKTLRITTRKTPCGEGSKTWDRFQMRIHKRFIDTKCGTEQIKQVTSIYIEPDVDVLVTM